MRLIYSQFSPFARKVRVTLAEKGLAFEPTLVTDYECDELLSANPIGQVPALVLDDGFALYDSRVICAWLEAKHPAPRLTRDGDAQWPVRRLEAMADAIVGNMIKVLLEGLRPEPLRSGKVVELAFRKTRRALDALEAEADPGGFDLGEIALVCALDYADLRAPALGWREGRPRLLARWERHQARPSIAATRPIAGP